MPSPRRGPENGLTRLVPAADPTMVRPDRSSGRGQVEPVAVGPGLPIGSAGGHEPRLFSAEAPAGLPTFPIQRAKVQAPPLRDETLTRERLIDWLSAKIHSRLVFVIAEAGYGKTTLLADFARQTRIRTLWYRLDRDDRDWVTFLNYLVAAGREIDPSFAPGTAACLREIGTTSPPREAILATFYRELTVLGELPSALIFDDFHIVDDAPDVREIVRELIVRAPERLTLVFSTRRRPTIPIARLRALGEVAELSTDDLRFDLSETERLFRDTYHQPLESDVLADLAARTEGWAASLQLVRAAIRDRGPAEIRAFVRELSGARGDLHDYLAEEVVGELEPEVQRFLMRTSILDVIDPEVASIVDGCEAGEARRIIEACERIGLLARRGLARDAVRYHPLVRDFLQARLTREVGEEGVRELHRAVARYADPRDWLLAAHHYAAANDIADLHRVIEEALETIMGTGQFASAEQFIDRFPGSSPSFGLFGSRMDFYRGDIERALTRAAASAEALRDGPNSDLARLNEMSLAILTGDVLRAHSLARELLDSDVSWVRSIAIGAQMLISQSVDGDLARTIEHFSQMAREQERAGHVHFLGITLLNLAITYRHRGHADEMLAAATQAVTLLESASRGPEVASARALRAWALAYLGNWQGAEAELELALTTTHLPTIPEVLREAADIHAAFGSLTSAWHYLERAREYHAYMPSEVDLWRLSASALVGREGRLDDARELLGATKLGSLAPEPATYVRQLVSKAAIDILSSDPAASSTLEDAEELALRQHATFWVRQCQLLRGYLGDVATWREALNRIVEDHQSVLSVWAERVCERLADLSHDLLTVVQNEATLRPERWRPPLRRGMASGLPANRIACARLLDQIGTHEDIPPLRALSRELRKHGASPLLGKGLARRLAPRVFVEDLGRAQVWVGDRLVPQGEIRRKVLGLLCFLISKPTMSATREQAIEALWPDLDPQTAVNSLNQTVYFLRRVFEPIYNEDLSPDFVSQDSDMIWLAPELIASRSGRCRSLIKEAIRSPGPDVVARLLEEYRERFALDFNYDAWAEPFRDWLHGAFLEVCERAVQDDMRVGQFARGIDVARRALEIDPAAESIKVLLIRLCKQTGAHAAAAEHYGRYAAQVRDELGIEPPKLEEL